ncbi:MAG: hypothetical protein IPP72_15175 [Chitinophagaceae bacterium]|nr:hypothetical protein [Chitinophagaceae bacterium]
MKEEVEKKLFLTPYTVDLMKQWRVCAFTHHFIAVHIVIDPYHQHTNVYKMKKVVVLGIIIACIALTCLYPHAMISPGELQKGHQDLNKKCLSCHSAFSGISMINVYPAINTDIGKDILNKKDTGARRFKVLFHQHLAKQECASCHSDHKEIVA